MKKIKQKKILKKVIIFSLVLMAFITVFNVKAQNDNEISDQSDAIAVKIIPNPNHYSISTWYSNQGFVGSPQSLTVDGYEAIRDGRTVYVNAANVSDNNINNIYTNIYVISYSQQPSEKTIDILGQIVSRWEFNDNLEDSFNEESATCKISSYTCDSDEDCNEGQYCSKEGETIGTCLLETEKNCLIDADCPAGYFCNSPKAIVIRDTKRIGMLEDMKTALSNYRERNGSYPTFQAGTYLENKSVSVWPSWKEKFLPEIAMSPTYVDTINRIGNCPGYDKDTCWNVEDKEFYSEPEYQSLNLPDNSYVMVYAVNEEGSEYNLCASLETEKINKRFIPGNYDGEACQTSFTASGGTGENVSPELVDFYLESQAEQELNGYIRVKDLNKDNLEWSLDTSMSNWSDWSSEPRLIDTSSIYEKKIYAQKTGDSTDGPYIVKVRVTDGEGGFYEEEFEIQINEPGIFIEAENSTHTLKVDVPFKYSLYFSGNTLPENLEDIDYSVSKISGPNIDVSNFIDLDAPTLEKVGVNRYKISYEGYIDPDDYQNDEFAEDVRLGFEVSVDDKNGREFSKEFYIDIISPKPPLDFSCPLTTRINTNVTGNINKYSCKIGTKQYLNSDVRYLLSGPELDIVDDFYFNRDKLDSDSVYLEGHPDIYGVFNIGIEAKTVFGASVIKSFNLQVNSYCGDGFVSEPNSEGKGGIYNDGYELCEGNSGIATSATSSRVYRQYGCTTNEKTNTPLEISSSNHCVFKGSLSGGGYCGDLVCQTKYEDKDNCAIDCDDAEEIVIVNHDCNNDSDCEEFGDEYYCSPLNNTCVINPYYCTSDTECGVGFGCKDNECTEGCWTKDEIVASVKFWQGDAQRFWDGDVADWQEGYAKYDYERRNKDTINYNQWNLNPSYYNDNLMPKYCHHEKEEDDDEDFRNNCSTIYIDDPYCENPTDYSGSGSYILCPENFDDGPYDTGEMSPDTDTCYRATGNWKSNWHNRRQYECRAHEEYERCYLDPCRSNKIIDGEISTELNGRISEYGNCVYVGENFCVDNSECEEGYECNNNNSCVKKCWNVENQTKTIQFAEGAAVKSDTGYPFFNQTGGPNAQYDPLVTFNSEQISVNNSNKECSLDPINQSPEIVENCTIVNIEHALCENNGGREPECPEGYSSSSLTLLDEKSSTYKCWGSPDNANPNNSGIGWQLANMYECTKTINEICYQDFCSTDTIDNGIVNSEGVCVNN